MNKKIILITFLMITIFFTSCINNAGENGTETLVVDPDPVSEDVVLPTPDEDLYIVGNIDGNIISFDSKNPTEYVILATSASTEQYFTNVRLSPDKNYVLYAKENSGQKDLTLLNINNGSENVVCENVASNESEFIDNAYLYYVHSGSILVYDITNATSTLIIPHQTDRCNHWPQVSPDTTKITYKDQTASPYYQDYSLSSWSPFSVTESSNECNDFMPYQAFEEEDYIGLYDSFYYNWRDNQTVIFKPVPGKTSKLLEKNIVTMAYQTNADITNNGEACFFTKVEISTNKDSLLLYGSNGVYIVDLTSVDRISGNINAAEVYYSTEIITQYGSIGSEGKSFVVATDKWIGIYNTAPIQKTSFSISSIYGDFTSIYSLYCR